MQYITTFKSQSSFLTWYVWVILGIIIKVSSHSDLTFPLSHFSIWRYQFECYRPFRILLKKNVKNWISNTTDYFFFEFTKIDSTSPGVFPSTLIPFTSITSSPTWINPERSAAPPCIILAITILPVSSSVFIVAPWKVAKEVLLMSENIIRMNMYWMGRETERIPKNKNTCNLMVDEEDVQTKQRQTNFFF